MNIKNGDTVLIYTPDKKTYLVTVEEGKRMSTHLGELALGDAIGLEYGSAIYSSLKHPFLVLEPTLEDRMMKVKRFTQIIYPKDAAIIIMKTGIKPGMRVIECGAGSGSLTIALANAVAPGGRVYTYDRSERFLENAKRNVEAAGYGDVVELKLREAGDGFDETGVDVVVLDLPSPWDGIPAAARALRGGGRIASLSPTYNQVEKAAGILDSHGFVFLQTVEVLVRHIRVAYGKTRPEERMVSHTGFLTFGRKALVKVEAAAEEPGGAEEAPEETGDEPGE
ncbi:MAG: tRNA (adenine-N1)-methyltransferase [Candidatus Dadabacteria bacterium]|nr:tRNA (adenine-N1)-methyltransferase [Candidatus Dadabacteria bacterium]